jgi:hypothetical protein
MSERKAGLPYLIDTGAIALGYYVEFNTEEEAEAFIAEANGTDVETVRRETAERARKLAEYRENMIRGSREKAARKDGSR